MSWTTTRSTKSSLRLPIALGVDFVGTPVIADLAKMPHLLIAGTTGSGKSVALNAMICSILFKAQPDDIKFLMVDPKRLELSSYEGIPHLMHPVVVDPKKASQVLRWTVEEMERRYKIISALGVKSIDAYNEMILTGPKGKADAALKDLKNETQPDADAMDSSTKNIPPFQHVKLPYIVVVIDELADLMMVASRRCAGIADAAGADGARGGHSPDPRHTAALRGRHHGTHQSQLPHAHLFQGIFED